MLRPHRKQNTSATPETTCWPTLVWTSTWLGKHVHTHTHTHTHLLTCLWVSVDTTTTSPISPFMCTSVAEQASSCEEAPLADRADVSSLHVLVLVLVPLVSSGTSCVPFLLGFFLQVVDSLLHFSLPSCPVFSNGFEVV